MRPPGLMSSSADAIAASADAERLTREVFGGKLGFLPWQRPGFDLGLKLGEMATHHPEYIGVVLGRIIKAAVSRQREFLADASAVQFTRNRDGLGGALRKIGGLSRATGLGSRIHHPNAEQLSHLFIGSPLAALVQGWLATHPPIAERLRRLYGKSVDLLDAPVLQEALSASPRLPDIRSRSASSLRASRRAAPSCGRRR